MKQCAFRIGLSAFAFWFCTLPAAPAEGVRVAQAAPNPPPARAPRMPTTGQVTPTPAAVPSGQVPAAQAPAPPQVPTRTEILNFENWAVTCNEFAESPKAKRCSALLQILQQNTNQIVFTWTVAMDDRKQLVAVMQTPTGVVIPPGVELRVGKLPSQKIPFASCDPGRCIATTTVDANLLREMTTSPTAEAVIQGSQGNTVQFTIQLKGFDRAYAVLSR
jgi:invasion protein IalB